MTSERNAATFVHFTHPNLRGRTSLQFVSADSLGPADFLFMGLPHGAMGVSTNTPVWRSASST